MTICHHNGGISGIRRRFVLGHVQSFCVCVWPVGHYYYPMCSLNVLFAKKSFTRN
jgi:hypothetical protein